MAFRTEQEKFWAGEFGDNYIQRNESDDCIKSNMIFFEKIMGKIPKVDSIIEFGANIGLNLKALHELRPQARLHAIEINEKAVKLLKAWGKMSSVFHGSILDYASSETFDLALVRGVLIHQNPQELPRVYDSIYKSSKKYILVAEYYNPTPVEISYRGHSEKLFKRDFAGEMLERFKDLKILDYGFFYRKDPKYPPQISESFDDITWFLMKKVTPPQNL